MTEHNSISSIIFLYKWWTECTNSWSIILVHSSISSILPSWIAGQQTNCARILIPLRYSTAAIIQIHINNTKNRIDVGDVSHRVSSCVDLNYGLPWTIDLQSLQTSLYAWTPHPGGSPRWQDTLQIETPHPARRKGRRRLGEGAEA